MQADPSVASALNDTLALEIGAFEVFHAFEHAFARKKYKGLKRWYDGHVDQSRDRRRWLTDRLFRLDSPATITMTATVVDPADSPEEIFSATLAIAQGLLASYQAGYVTAGSAGDCVTAYGFCDGQKAVEKLIGCCEAFATQIAEIGLSEFLGQRTK